MLKRSFNIKLTNKELGALVTVFDVKGTKHVDGKKFVSEFCRVGCQRRDDKRKQIMLQNKEHEEFLRTAEQRRLLEAEQKYCAAGAGNCNFAQFFELLCS